MIPCNYNLFFFAELLNKPFQDQIRGRRLKSNPRRNRHVCRVSSLYSLIFVGPCKFKYNCRKIPQDDKI